MRHAFPHVHGLLTHLNSELKYTSIIIRRVRDNREMSIKNIMFITREREREENIHGHFWPIISTKSLNDCMTLSYLQN